MIGIISLVFLLITTVSLTIGFVKHRMKKAEELKELQEAKRQKEYQDQRRAENEEYNRKAQMVDVILQKTTTGMYKVIKKDGNGAVYNLIYTKEKQYQQWDQELQKNLVKLSILEITDSKFPRDHSRFSWSGSYTLFPVGALTVLKQVIEYFQKYKTLEPVIEDVEIFEISRYIPPPKPKPVLNELGFIDPKPDTLEELTPLLIEAVDRGDEHRADLIHSRMKSLKLLPEGV
jgi:hypothetical protein